MSKLDANDQQLDANLSIMLQTAHGTKQYWFTKQGKLRCMVREFSTPTLFLTFSCAEYESHDIIAYIRAVNNVPDSYNNGKLCTEDPVSVSRQFSNKFHAFFKKVLLKGNVLGVVSHYFWKKEYQNCGAPHYHVLLWIQDAPVIGIDDPQKVLAWGLLASFLTRTVILICMRWLPGTKCTSAVLTAREKSSWVEYLSLPANSISPESRVRLLFCTVLNKSLKSAKKSMN